MGSSLAPRKEAREVALVREKEERGEKEKVCAKRGERRREGGTKMSGLYRKEPLGKGSSAPGLESSGLGTGHTR